MLFLLLTQTASAWPSLGLGGNSGPIILLIGASLVCRERTGATATVTPSTVSAAWLFLEPTTRPVCHSTNTDRESGYLSDLRKPLMRVWNDTS